MLKEDARVHAMVWVAAAQKMLPRAGDDNETARTKRVVAELADTVGRSWAALADGNHPITGKPMREDQ